ncbi:unnamed protein product [Candidula unifasciata]|uniref:C2H2-type domain-containing protein n=1 Tax=Candidula unifasciata TaxID=100452 RepID=A0A8S4A185_9EUPU|nr:unnamed protein product [Candidula unifasciata]
MDVASNKCSVEGCGKSFKRKDRLATHIRTHTGERPFLCHYDGCSSSYTRQHHLTRHIDRSHTPGFKNTIKIKCPSCSLELANSDCLKKHMKCHEAHKPYKCTEEGCNESFYKKKQLVIHKQKQHSDHLIQARKCYPCPHEGCRKSFPFPRQLKHHMKVHQGYACSVEGCAQILPNWSALRKHRAVDHAPTHSCTVCRAVFKQKSNWKQHIKIHSVSQKPIACPRENCGRLYLYKKNLTQHIRAFHNGEAVFKKRPCKKQITSVKQKQKVSHRKSLTARLCGIDKDKEVVKSSVDLLQREESNENLQNSTATFVSDSGASITCTSGDSGDITSTPARSCADTVCTETLADCNKNVLPSSSLIRIQ